MSDSIYFNTSDLDDMDDIELIMQAIKHDQSLQQNEAESPRRTRLMNFSVIMKCTSTIRQLAYGTSPYALDEYLQMGEHCARNEQFGKGDKKYPTIMLEAVASYDLLIWQAFSEVPGVNNDLTVLNSSLLFDDLLYDNALVVSFEVNGVTFEKLYYLDDGIYL
nr:hypothetical protein [Tanacetum cinerariifolium]